MTARQRSESHISSPLGFLREICKASAFERPSDFTADGMNRIMASDEGRGETARTIQARVVA